MELKIKGIHRGYEYIVISMDLGYRNGYVKVPESHPLFGKHYDEEIVWKHLVVHGGLTFSHHVVNDYPHLSEGFWFGFDCAHYCDAADPDEMDKEYLNTKKEIERRIKLAIEKFGKAWEDILGVEPWMKTPMPEPKIRNNGFVESQCRNLCDQLAEIQTFESLLGEIK